MSDTSGTTFPSGVTAGFRFYRTDRGEWFEYQPAIDGWIGESHFHVQCAENVSVAGAVYPRFVSGAGGTQITRYSATIGIPAPWDCVLWRATLAVPSSSTVTVDIHDDGSAIQEGGSPILLPLVSGTRATWFPGAPDVTAEDSILAPHVSTGTATNGMLFDAVFRRYEPA